MIGGIVLDENSSMLTMCREFGFCVSHLKGEPGLSNVSLSLFRDRTATA
jgi:acetyltransferase